jgi:peptidoglycan/xylan/chitin deacetylase (PgdA/CDA1 family)
VTILCYHSVEADWESPMAVEPSVFAQHCAWLARRREVLPLHAAVGRLSRAGRLPRGTAALTFDDGFEALHAEVTPLLRRHHLPATVFLVAQTLAPGGRAVDWVDTAGGRELRTLSLDQVLEMQEQGVDFQSHSWAHLDLTTLRFDECVRDLRESRELLEELLGRKVGMLAYPRGRHDTGVRSAAQRAGYQVAFGLPERREAPGPFSVPRVGVHRGNSAGVLRVKSSPAYLPVRHSPAAARAARTVRRLAAR